MTGDRNPAGLCAARELVGAILARALGLAVPDYALVFINEEFIRSTADDEEEGPRIVKNSGWNFGSIRLDNVFVTIPNDPPAWENVLAFDAMALNGDRTAGRPNVLWDGDILYAIDHALIAPTWQHSDPSTIFDARHISSHASYAVLRKQGRTFDELPARWCAGATPDLFSWAVSQVPLEWWPVSQREKLAEFLKNRKDIADPQKWELRRVLG